MASNNNHLIQKQVFDITLENQDDLPVISKELERLIGSELSAFMDELFSNSVSKEHTIRIPLVEITLGNIDLHNFSATFAARFKQKLAAVFAERLIAVQGSLNPTLVLDKPDRDLELVRYFIQRGYYPWWAGRLDSRLDPLFQQLMAIRKRKTRQMVMTEGRVLTQRQRIVHQFQDETLYRLFGLLSADPDDYFRYHVDDLIAVHQQRKIVNEEDRKLKKVVHELILTYLIDHQATSVDQVAFLRFQLEKLGRRYGVSYRRMVGYIRQALSTLLPNGQFGKSGIAPVIETLYQEMAHPGTVSTTFLPSSYISADFEALQYYLTHGYFDPNAVQSRFNTEEALLLWVLKAHQEAFVALLYDIGRNRTVRRRIINNFNTNTIRQLFGVLTPSNIDLLYAYFEVVERVQTRVAPINQEKIGFRKVIQELALKYLIEKPKSRLHNTDFLKRQIAALSSRYHVGYSNVVRLLHTELSSIAAHTQSMSDLRQTVQILYEKVQKVKYYSLGFADASNVPAGKAVEANQSAQYSDALLSSSARSGVNVPETALPTTTALASILLSTLAQLERRGFIRGLSLSGIGVGITPEILASGITSDARDTWTELLLKQLVPTASKDRNQLYKGLLLQMLSGWETKNVPASRAEKQLLTRFLLSEVIQDHTRVSRLHRYKSFLDFILDRKKMMSVSATTKVLEQIGLPDQLDQSAIQKLVSLLVLREATSFYQLVLLAAQYKMEAMGRVGQSAFYRYIANRLLQEPKMRLDLRVFTRDILLHLAGATGKSLEHIAQAILDMRIQLPPYLARVLASMVRGATFEKKDIQERISADTFRTSLPEMLLELGIINTIKQENQDEGALIRILDEYLYDRTADFIDIIEKNRFDERILRHVLENLNIAEVQHLLKAILKDKYAVWLQSYEAVLKFQQHFAPFRVPAEQLRSILMPWTLQYVLALTVGKFSESSYLYYLLEHLHERSLIDIKRLTKLLGDTAQRDTIPPVWRAVLEEYTDQDVLVNLRPSFMRAQYGKDLLLYYLEMGQPPFWADQADVAPSAMAMVMAAAIRDKDISLVQKVVGISKTAKTVARLQGILGPDDPFQLLGMLDRSDAEQGIGQFFGEMALLFRGLRRDLPAATVSSKLFHFFLKERLWTYATNVGRGMVLLEKISSYLTIDRDVLINAVQTSGSKALIDTFSPAWDDAKKTLLDREKAYTDLFLYLVEHGKWPSGLSAGVEKKTVAFIQQKAMANHLADLLESVSTGNDTARRVQHLTKMLKEPVLLDIIRASVLLKRTSHPLLYQLLSGLLDAIDGPKASINKAFWTALLLEYAFFGRMNDAQSVRAFAEAIGRKDQPFYRQFTAQLAQKAAVQQAGNLVSILRQFIGKRKGAKEAYVREQQWAILRHYLQFGTIPAHQPGYDKKKLLETVFELFLLSETLFRKQLFTLWKIRSSRALFLALFDDNRAREILAYMVADLADALQLLESTLAQSEYGGLWAVLGISDDSGTVRLIGEIWANGNKVVVDPMIIVHELFKLYARKLQFRPSILIKQLMIREPAEEPANRRILEQLNAKIATEERIARKITPADVPVEKAAKPKEGIHVYNAGIALIWPFLGRFFRRLNMVEGDDFRDEAMRMRAVLLCQFIVTGNTVYQENELVLNKLLCGMELETVVENELDIRDDERALAESMLAGVIHNWEKLQGTRVNTFRETFLQREGRLTWMEEEHWELVVEKRAYDVLLTTLPWQIKMIKYGWMKHRLIVVWQ